MDATYAKQFEEFCVGFEGRLVLTVWLFALKNSAISITHNRHVFGELLFLLLVLVWM